MLCRRTSTGNFAGHLVSDCCPECHHLIVAHVGARACVVCDFEEKVAAFEIAHSRLSAEIRVKVSRVVPERRNRNKLDCS